MNNGERYVKAAAVITPATKVAAIIIALGADSASEVYKYLRDEEIEEITSEISRIDLLSSDDMKEIIDDFYDMCITCLLYTSDAADE